MEYDIRVQLTQTEVDGEEGVQDGKEGREVVGSHSPLEEDLHRKRCPPFLAKQPGVCP